MDVILLEINAKIFFSDSTGQTRDGAEDGDLFLVNLAVSAADQVSCALQTEPKESRNAEYKEQSDCPECEAVPAMPPWKSL